MIGLIMGAAASGLVGSPHCIGMCGPFAIACGGSPREFGAWHLGRLTTYSALGALAGGFGYMLPGPAWVGGVISALFVVAFSLVLAGLVPEPRLGTRRVQEWATRALNNDSLGGRFVFGLANGLLPCGLVYAALGLAVAAGTPLWGAMVMLAFGLGTSPALATVAIGLRKGFGKTVAARRVMAAMVLVSGLFSVWTRASGQGHGANAHGAMTHAVASDPAEPVPSGDFHIVGYDVPLRSYFEVLDSLIATDSVLGSMSQAEHLLVRANPWLIERLENTDYYRMKDRGIESLDPQAELALRKGDTLWVPSEHQIMALRDTFSATTLDLNIPEFRLRIVEHGTVRHTFPVRVGQNRTRYLEMAGREVDLRTRTGTGTIVRIEKNPTFANPVDNHRYEQTRRDDDVVTGLPRIPFLEPEIDGVRYGQLIHPTTNATTLGKAYSNGCVGTSEAAAWRIYYSAPLGTAVEFRYDREVPTMTGDTVQLSDVYDPAAHRRERAPADPDTHSTC